MRITYVKPGSEVLAGMPRQLICESLVSSIDDFDDLVDYEW